MSSTPTTTPRRQRPQGSRPTTPGSANTSASFDRSTILDRIEELDLEVHDLRRQIKALRSSRRSTFASSSTPSLALQYFDPSGRTVGEIKEVLKVKLRELDDSALTALLTASTEGLREFVSGGNKAGLVGPSKSVGIEGTGSGAEIDRRIKGEGVKEGVEEKRHALSVNAWLKDRERRSSALLSSLASFSHFEMESLTQTQSSSGNRSVRFSGTMARLFGVEVKFNVVEDPALSPRIENLQLTLPDYVREALNTPHRLYDRLLRRNDLPAILLMLRTMIPLISLRRNLFTSLMETFTDLVRDHVRSWEREHGVDFAPWHPSSSSRTRTTKSTDEALARSLILPSAADSLVLKNKRGASLLIRFVIQWNRFGHASPHITAHADVPRNLLHATSTAFLKGFSEEFEHLIKTAIARDGIIGLPDREEEDEEGEEVEAVVGRWGVMPALNATVRAFFGLGGEEGESGSEESREG